MLSLRTSEFHDQLLLLRGVLESIPGRVFSEMLHKWSESARQTRESRMQAHITLTEEDKQQRVSVHSLCIFHSLLVAS